MSEIWVWLYGLALWQFWAIFHFSKIPRSSFLCICLWVYVGFFLAWLGCTIHPYATLYFSIRYAIFFHTCARYLFLNLIGLVWSISAASLNYVSFSRHFGSFWITCHKLPLYVPVSGLSVSAGLDWKHDLLFILF